MVIKSLKETSYKGMIKIASTEGAAFYVRKEYLNSIDFDSIEVGACFEGAEEDELLDAGMAAVVEFKALGYLGRAEQSRFGLSRKLRAKDYEQIYIDMALDYLEAVNYLSDTRFANAWVVSRLINHYEGKSKLKAELGNRGIARDVAEYVVEDVFEEFDEIDICQKAYKKFQRKGKTGDKLKAAMIGAGFTFKQIREVEENLSNYCN